MKRALCIVIAVCISLYTGMGISDELELNSVGDFYRYYMSDVPLLNINEVIGSVPDLYNPMNHVDFDVYATLLSTGKSNGELSDSEVTTLAFFMSEICDQVEKNCMSFYLKDTKPRRSIEDYYSFSFSAGIAAYRRTGSLLGTKYGKITAVNGYKFCVAWNDGETCEYSYTKDKSGNGMLNGKYPEVNYSRGVFSELWGAYKKYVLGVQ